MTETDFTASNGARVTRDSSDLWWTVQGSINNETWTMDEEDLDLAYARNAVEVWTAWVEYLEDGRA